MSLKTEIYPDDGIFIESYYPGIIKEVCEECTRAYKEPLCAGVYLTDDDGIRSKNLEFRHMDNATDVLSFPLLEAKNGRLVHSEMDRDKDAGCILLGDIVISLDKVNEQAMDYGHSKGRELAFLVCHGMLHLLGYDHVAVKDEKKMLVLQERILGSLGFKRQEEK